MKRFILKIFLMSLFVITTLGVVAMINKRYFLADNYLMEFPVKQKLIVDTPSPKLVVLGGSNVAFGIDSKMLSDSLGIPVVNAGLHAGFGLRYIMHATTPWLRRGDILVVMPEYGHFFGDAAWGNSATICFVPYFASSHEMVDMNREQLVAICKGWGRETLKMFVGEVKNAFFPMHDGKFKYLKSGFDDMGDEVSHRFQPSPVDMSHYKPVPCLTSFNEKYIEEFISDMLSLQKRGIQVFLLPPACYESSLSADRRVIDQLSERFSAADIPYAASLDKFAYPNIFLYDSENHLNANGAKLNTLHLFSVIKSKINLAN